MTIEFRCAQCNRLLRTGDDTGGKQAKCPECGAVTTVPVPGAVPPVGEAGGPFAPGGAAPGDAENPYEAPRQYGQTPQQPYQLPKIDTGFPPRHVPNYLVQAILCTCFCCLPFGVVAIVFAAQVNGKLAAGDYAGAVSYSDSARTWCWVSFWLGIIPIMLWFLMVCAGGLAGF